jgi:hypothetical protein
MTYDEKVTFLLKDLSRRGTNPYTAAPPLYRLLWRLGIEAKPPLFASFWSVAITTGVMFGVLWGILMRFVPWQQSWPVGIAIGTAALAGALFGLTMAAYYRGLARRLALPRWEDYPTA